MKDTNAITTEMLSALRDSHVDCFACGTGNDSGLSLHFEIGADGVASAVWQPLERFRSYANRLHGGVIATLLDCAMVHALFARGVAGVTAEMTVRYLHGIGFQDPLDITGCVVSERHGIMICRADIHQGGVRAVRASAKFMVLPPND